MYVINVVLFFSIFILFNLMLNKYKFLIDWIWVIIKYLFLKEKYVYMYVLSGCLLYMYVFVFVIVWGFYRWGKNLIYIE